MTGILLTLGVSGFLCGITLTLMLRSRAMSPALQLSVTQTLLLIVFINAAYLAIRRADGRLDLQTAALVLTSAATAILLGVSAYRSSVKRSSPL